MKFCYKETESSIVTGERFNDVVQSSILDSNSILQILQDDNFQNEKDIIEFCDEFNTFWFDCDFADLEEQIRYLLKRTIMIEKMSNFSEIFIEKEIHLTLIEIVSVFTLEEDNNQTFNPQSKLDLLDYIEAGQSILDESYKALNFISYYSDKIADSVISTNITSNYNIIDVICTNVMDKYSELTRMSALFFLGGIVKHDKTLLKLAHYPNFLKFLLNDFVSVGPIERLRPVVYLASKIARRSDNPNTNCFKEDLMNIFFFSFGNAPDLINDTICGTFYLIYNNQNLIFNPTTEVIIANTLNSNDQFVIYFLIQILKICNMNLPNERLFNIYSHVDFQCFNAYMKINEPIFFATANFFNSLFQNGSQFIQLCGVNFDCLFQAYSDASIEIKAALLNTFDIAFIEADKNQLSYFLQKNYDDIIFDKIDSQDQIDLCLDAIIAIANFNQDRIKDHQELYDVLIQPDIIKEDEIETMKKASYILSILTS